MVQEQLVEAMSCALQEVTAALVALTVCIWIIKGDSHGSVACLFCSFMVCYLQGMEGISEAMDLGTSEIFPYSVYLHFPAFLQVSCAKML